MDPELAVIDDLALPANPRQGLQGMQEVIILRTATDGNQEEQIKEG
jgi:hypothetical protein